MNSQSDHDLAPLLSVVHQSEFRTTARSVNPGTQMASLAACLLRHADKRRIWSAFVSCVAMISVGFDECDAPSLL